MEDRHRTILKFDEDVARMSTKVAHPNVMGSASERTPCLGPMGYVAVFDGHGGAEAAQFAADNLNIYLARSLSEAMQDNRLLDDDRAKEWVNFTNACMRSIDKGVRMTEEAFFAHAHDSDGSVRDGSGTCICFALVRGKQLYIAHAGDCRAVLCSANETIPLTTDHTGRNPDEVEWMKMV
jgi:serine/threonine protein phosphatase PrpC